MEQSLTDETMPKTFQGDTLVTSNLRWWCSGFFPGTAWYAYKLGGDTKELALRQTAKMLDTEVLSDHHDIGFRTSTDPDSIKSYRHELYGALESWLEKL